MGRTDNEVIDTKLCECGCKEIIEIKRWHLSPSKGIPKMKRGHGQEGNKYGWKGGERKANGYILIYSPDHPNTDVNKSVRRARLIIEKDIGRYLFKHEIVHHINGIKDDDRIENLIVMGNSEHLSLHHKNRIKKRDNYGRFANH